MPPFTQVNSFLTFAFVTSSIVHLTPISAATASSNQSPTQESEQVKCQFEHNTEYYARSYRKLSVPFPAKCCEACQEDPACNVWTYKMRNKNEQTCWLIKDATYVRAIRTDRDMISGIREARKGPFLNITFEEGFHYKEKTLYKGIVESLYECTEFCRRRLLCKSFTYDNESRWCYGKRGTWGKQRVPSKYVSGIVW